MTENNIILDKFAKWRNESEDDKSSYSKRWVDAIKSIKGIFPEEEKARSDVRKRNKLFFRKTWAVRWRMMASLYQAFLRDRESFKISGRDDLDDPRKARVLHNMVKYRIDELFNKASLFLKILWGFLNIFDMGLCCAKIFWDTENDRPEVTIYPNEQAFPDLKAETKEEMEYFIFENYKSLDWIKARYEIDEETEEMLTEEAIPESQVRAARYMDTQDPLQNPSEKEYPEPGRYLDSEKEKHGGLYKIWEVFYKEDGKIMLAVTCSNKVVLQEPKKSPYGDRYPVALGVCLTEANKIIGEDFPTPLKGPQDSFNFICNARKDNLALLLNKGAIVSRFGQVDLKSLMHARPNRIIMANEPDAVKWEDPPDVTQTAYIEAAADEKMMEEMSGIVDAKQGTMSGSQKATTAQINLQESNAKIDLFTAIIGETFVKEIYLQIAYLIQKFDNDKKIIRIANERLRRSMAEETGYTYGPENDVYKFDDFDADCKITVGSSNAGRAVEVQQIMLAMEKAIQSNQTTVALLSSGAVPQGGQARFFDMTKFMDKLLPKIGIDDFRDTYYKVSPPPPQQAGGSGGSGAGIAGSISPQMGGMGATGGMNAGGARL